ncbi:DMT family transporter [Estrella lausannensis]|uniref:Putative membrane protein n=1 Tax=Estrella lausannensis TaxID=483423 RepID=A0A0H5DT39_9BACT|nr:DMT family transporter [Estrella lausannensis]CRX39523.1 putative membrane protein [Estrella lausannensis]
MWQIFLMYALFGSVFTVGKAALAFSPPYFLTAYRMLLSGGVLLVYQWIKDPSSIKEARKWGPLLLGIAFFNVFITNAFEFWGLQYMSAGKTSLLYSISPFAAALFAYLLSTEAMNRTKAAGIALGLFSFAPLLLNPWQQPGSDMRDELAAEAALAVSALTSVIGWYLFKSLSSQSALPGAAINGISFIIAGVMSLAVSLLFEEAPPLSNLVESKFLLAFFYIVLVHNLFCYAIYAKSLKSYSVTFLTFAGLSNPLFAAITGALILQETVEWPFYIALLGGAGGLYLIFRGDEISASQKATPR